MYLLGLNLLMLLGGIPFADSLLLERTALVAVLAVIAVYGPAGPASGLAAVTASPSPTSPSTSTEAPGHRLQSPDEDHARGLNRATLARQLLLRRERLRWVAVHRLLALQAQEPASPYLALWNRVDGFDPADLDKAYATGSW